MEQTAKFDEKKYYAECAIKADVRASIMRAGLRPFCSDPKNARFVKVAFDETEYAEQYAQREIERFNEKFAEVTKKDEQEDFEKKMTAASDEVVRDMVIREYLTTKEQLSTLDAFDKDYLGIVEEKKNEDNE